MRTSKICLQLPSFNTLKIFCLIYQVIRNIIVAKKTRNLVLFSHKNTTKLVFLWLSMNLKSIKVLIWLIHITYYIFFKCLFYRYINPKLFNSNYILDILNIVINLIVYKKLNVFLNFILQ